MKKDLRELIEKERQVYRRFLSCKTELQRSCWGGTPEGWRRAREVILKAVRRDGSFLDVGCANGVLVRDLRRWAREKGIALRPYGIDLLEEFIPEARQKNPKFKNNFFAAEMMAFKTREKFTYIRVENYGPYRSPESFFRKYLGMLEADGRLIITHYDHEKDQFAALKDYYRNNESRFRYSLVGTAEVPRTTLVLWMERAAPETGTVPALRAGNVRIFRKGEA